MIMIYFSFDCHRVKKTVFSLHVIQNLYHIVEQELPWLEVGVEDWGLWILHGNCIFHCNRQAKVTRYVITKSTIQNSTADYSFALVVKGFNLPHWFLPLCLVLGKNLVDIQISEGTFVIILKTFIKPGVVVHAQYPRTLGDGGRRITVRA